jgi:hypothetical protein
VLARFLGLLKHGLLEVETHLSDLLLGTPELSRQREHHMLMSMPVGGGDIFDQRRLIAVQHVHVIGGGCECKGASLLLYPPLLLCREHSPNSVEVFIFLSFLTASSLNFCALIHMILLLWMGVSPRGHQRGAGAVLGTVVLDVLFYPDPGEIGWSGLPNRTGRFRCCCEQATTLVLIFVSLPGALFCFSATSSGPFSVLCFCSSSVEVLFLGSV